jgi:hypothetical protein
MSIQSEINRIKTNIANAYRLLEEKGATMPDEKNSDNLVETINSLVIFVDIDADGYSPAYEGVSEDLDGGTPGLSDFDEIIDGGTPEED